MMKFANAFETESFVIKEELHTYHSKLQPKGNQGIYDGVSQLDLERTRTCWGYPEHVRVMKF